MEQQRLEKPESRLTLAIDTIEAYDRLAAQVEVKKRME
jgi:hypothetical protein